MFYETNSAGTTCYPHANEQNLYIDLPKEKFKIDKWPKSKSENNKTLRRKQGKQHHNLGVGIKAKANRNTKDKLSLIKIRTRHPRTLTT